MCSASVQIVQVPGPQFPHRSFGRALAVEVLVLAPPCAHPGQRGSAPVFPLHPHLRSRAEILEDLITPN